jgi:hypothetical protein
LVSDSRGTSPGLRTTSFDYYESVGAPSGHYGRLRQVTYPSGSWERYEYHGDSPANALFGLVWKTTRPLSSGIPNSPASDLTTTFEYLPDLQGTYANLWTAWGDDGSSHPLEVRAVEERLGSTVTKLTRFAFTPNLQRTLEYYQVGYTEGTGDYFTLGLFRHLLGIFH